MSIRRSFDLSDCRSGALHISDILKGFRAIAGTSGQDASPWPRKSEKFPCVEARISRSIRFKKSLTDVTAVVVPMIRLSYRDCPLLSGTKDLIKYRSLASGIRKIQTRCRKCQNARRLEDRVNGDTRIPRRLFKKSSRFRQTGVQDSKRRPTSALTGLARIGRPRASGTDARSDFFNVGRPLVDGSDPLSVRDAFGHMAREKMAM